LFEANTFSKSDLGLTMDIFLILLTCFAYIFILVAYSAKIVKYARMPIHLRWELFTATKTEKKPYHHGLTAFEAQPFQSSRWRLSNVWSFLKEYLWFHSYLSHDKTYWCFLYIAHIGFVSLIIFQAVCIATALGTFLAHDQTITAERATGSLVALRILLAIISFAAGIIGNIGLMVYRISHRDLRLYTPPLTFIGYCISICTCLIGFILLLTNDPHFSGYVLFFVGMFQIKPIAVSGLLGLFIFLNILHLIYLPFTPGFHYVTRFFAFFNVLWDTRPNQKGSPIEKAIGQVMGKKITWSAPHIKSGQTWEQAAKHRS